MEAHRRLLRHTPRPVGPRHRFARHEEDLGKPQSGLCSYVHSIRCHRLPSRGVHLLHPDRRGMRTGSGREVHPGTVPCGHGFHPDTDGSSSATVPGSTDSRKRACINHLPTIEPIAITTATRLFQVPTKPDPLQPGCDQPEYAPVRPACRHDGYPATTRPENTSLPAHPYRRHAMATALSAARFATACTISNNRARAG